MSEKDVAKEVIIETRIKWLLTASGGDRDLIAVFRGRDFVNIESGYGSENGKVTIEQIRADPTGFAAWSAQVSDQCLVADVKARVTGKG